MKNKSMVQIVCTSAFCPELKTTREGAEEKKRGMSSLQANRKGCGCQGLFKETMKGREGRKGGPLDVQFVSLETL